MNENDNTYLFLFFVAMIFARCARHGAPERGRRKMNYRHWQAVETCIKLNTRWYVIPWKRVLHVGM